MPYPEELNYWIEELSTALPHLSLSQRRVLGLYSYGMVMTRHCGQTIVVSFLALLLGVRGQNLRQRLREWTYEVGQKRGDQRRAVEVETSFAPLLRWILGHWLKPRRLILAADVTYLRDRHTILAISVVYRGCAIPVAWRVLKGNEAGQWYPLWVILLDSLRAAVPTACEVFVLWDRGLYSKRLFEKVCQMDWHPVMRVRAQGFYQRVHRKTWHSLAHVASRGMSNQALRVQCFKGDPLACTLWVQWPAPYDEPCLLVTDLHPRRLHRHGHPYALRSWIEAGFKDLKRGGLHWEQSKMSAPDRIQRWLFIMSLALFWLVRQGSTQADELAYAGSPSSLSLTTLGWLNTLVCALHARPLSFSYFSPYSFPRPPS